MKYKPNYGRRVWSKRSR